MVADYFLIRGTRLEVQSLYHRSGPYEYTRGINPRAMIALALGVVVALVGLLVPSLRFLYDYAWFVGFFTAGATYTLLMLSERQSATGAHLTELISPAGLAELETE